MIDEILATKAELLGEEKLLLFALILGLKPQSVLEIGCFEGGSSAIILQALEANGSGQLYSIDPNPQVPITEGRPGWLARWHLMRGSSPEAVGRLVSDLADVAPFDFVFIDGDHSKQAVIADVEGVIPYLTDAAYLLLHDAFAPGVEDAIEYMLAHTDAERCAGNSDDIITDCGLLCNTFVYLPHMQANYYGMRLLRFERG